MRRTAILGVFTACLLGVTGSASANGRGGSINKSLGELRWGMGQSEVVSALIEKIEESYADEIQRTRMTPKETDVRRRMKAEISDLRAGHVTFNGSSRWDNTFLEGEYTHGNNESLVTYADSSSRNFYFFINGKLWKWVKAFDQPTFSGKDFDDFSRFVRDRFGSGSMKRGSRTPAGNAVRFMELGDAKTRLRAFDRIGGDRSFALVFEDKGTIGKLASLRKNRARSGGRGDDREVARNDSEESSAPSQPGRFGDRRSLSTHEEPTQETDAQFRARQERESREQRQFQQDQHARRQQAQRGRTLDGLAGMNDSDPMSGLGQ